MTQTLNPLSQPGILIALDAIEPNPYQPRTDFNELELQNLADSLKEHGLLQDVLLRSLGNGRYQLVSGERRWRAAHLAGWHSIPAKVRALTDLEVSELALVENVQRSSLNPIEEARGIENHIRFAAENGIHLTPNDIRRKLGRSMGWLEKKRALLKLPDYLQKAVERNGAVQSSVLEIAKVEDYETQEKLIEQVDNGASYATIRAQVDRIIVEQQNRATQAKASSTPPDSHTAQRQAAIARGNPGNVSRGRQVTTDNSRTAKFECDRGAALIDAWLESLPERERRPLANRLRNMVARLDPTPDETA